MSIQKSIFIVLIVASQILLSATSSNDKPCCSKKCTGSEYCSACKNCSGCAHCNSGGYCGFCRSEAYKKAPQKTAIKQKKSTNSIYKTICKKEKVVIT